MPRDLAVFLPLFAIALNKMAAYPDGHPLLVGALESATVRLQAALVERSVLMIGVARTQLLVEGLATDADNPILRDLAQKLHRHQLGAIKFIHGVTRDEMAQVCRALAGDFRTQPLGAGPREALERWPSVRLFPPAYERLELSDERRREKEAASNAGRLWQGLASTALAKEGVDLNTDARVVAEALNQGMPDQEKGRKLVQYLLGLGRELRLSQASESSELRQRLDTLFAHVNPETMRQLLAHGSDPAQRRQLLRDASEALPTNAVLTLLRAGSGDGTGQPISNAMIRMLSKLASQADTGAVEIRESADLVLRESVRQLVDRWTLEDPNPTVYSHVLERLSRHRAHREGPAGEAVHPFEALRIIYMALETNTVGDLVWAALEEVAQEGRAGEVAGLLGDGRVAPDIVEQFWQHLATPDIMRILLTNEPRDTLVVEELLERMGMSAAEPMLETLEVADSRGMRRRLLTRLGKLGPAVGPTLVERLRGAPWYVARNLLALLGSLHEMPPEFDPVPYAEHEDARVRREAIKLMLRLPQYREAAIIACVGDDDNQNLQLGLAAALERCPPAAVGRVRILLNDRRLPVELRLSAMKVLGTVRTSATRDWLVGEALTQGTWFRRRRLAPKSAELLVVLGCLARQFPGDPAAQAVLRLAGESPDPEIRAAIKEPV
jgi:hypothetical protein